MYYVQKTLEISSAHMLMLDHNSKCENLHGHNWIVNVYCKAKELDDNGMVTDFTIIKEMVHGKLDHKYLNEVLDFNLRALTLGYDKGIVSVIYYMHFNESVPQVKKKR